MKAPNYANKLLKLLLCSKHGNSIRGSGTIPGVRGYMCTLMQKMYVFFVYVCLRYYVIYVQDTIGRRPI